MPHELLKELGITGHARLSGPGPGGAIESINPSTNEPIASVGLDDAASYEKAVEKAQAEFKRWRATPAPRRGEIVRLIGEALREHREPLGALVSLEMGKIRTEGVGEVQEAIDIADFSVGLSRQLYGLTIASERPKHRMFEQWHPLGPIGVITAFNFPVAVWAWNAMVAAVCGDTVLWKPSLVTPLTSVATHHIVRTVAEREGHPNLFQLVIGKDDVVGETMIADRRLPLISATGSCRMGRHVAQAVAKRLGRCLLELGGNNAVIVIEDADMELAVRGVLFGAVGTAGQRCTSTRRLIAHSSVADDMASRLVRAYGNITIGDPLEKGTLMGPLISKDAVEQMMQALKKAKEQGGEILTGGEKLDRAGNFVTPAIVRIPKGKDLPISKEETFAPILYVFEYENLEDAIAMQNDVDQGLSSAIFTGSVRASELFLSPEGSDCGIANVNLGTSGAEIGGAFGGEKDTGGGRESGSDSWKAYMRRQTNTVNYGADLPLAQGVEFG
ncbi:MAG: aldehyde dehydrogenase family protein [Phycisphaeraceae bacterium]|nr:MAG: aldehyde dehydrogenase family protein [Phycisphaeraceae bacterium]